MKTKITLALAAFSITASQAATIASYDFSVLTGTRNDWASAQQSNTFNSGVILSGTTEATVVSNLTLSNLTDAGPGSVVTGTTAGLSYSTVDSANGNVLQDGELNLAGFDNDGDGNNNYFQFTLTADTGYTIDINSVSIGLWRNGGGAAEQQAFSYSVDGGSFSAYDSSQAAPAGGGAFVTYSFTEAISGAESVTFRYVPFGPSGSTGNIHINALSVDGSVVAVPEPSSLCLLGLGAVALVHWRRR